MNKFRRKAKKSLLGALSLLSAFSSVAPMSAMNKKNGEDSITVDYDDDDLDRYDTEAEEEKKPGLSTAAKVGIGVGVAGAAALGIGVLASYLSKSDGEIGKKITIEDIDLQNRYNNGAIDEFAIGEKIDSATMKQEFPNSQSKIKDGFNYEYLGGKEFKVIDIYLNNGQSCVYLGADIKNSPTLKNMNESNGNPIDSKAYYRVTNTNGNYTIVKSDAPNLNPVPVQNPVLNPPAQPFMPPQLPPANNLPSLYTARDVEILANNSTLSYDLAELDGSDYLYEMDSINRKVKKSVFNIYIFSTEALNTHSTYSQNNPVSGQILLNTLERFPDKCKLYGQYHKLDPSFNYEIEFKYDRETKGIQIRPLLAEKQIISASQAYDLGLINEEPQPNVFFVINDINVPQLHNNVVVVGNRLFENNKDRLDLNPGIIYVLGDNDQLVVHDINKEYLRSHKDNRFTIDELSRCLSLKGCLIPGTSVKFKDLNTLRYQAGNNGVLFGDLDCVITSLDNPSVCLVSSAPLETFTLLDDDSLGKFKIYENPNSPTPLTAQQLKNINVNRRVHQDQRTGKLCLTQMPGLLSREEDRILHPPVRPIPNMILDNDAVPGVYGPGDGTRLGNNIANLTNVNTERWSVTKYLSHLIDAPTSQHCYIGVVGGNDIMPNQIGSYNLDFQYFKEVFEPRGLIPGLNLGERYVRKRRVRGVNGDNNVYNLYEIVGFVIVGATYVPRYANLLIEVGTQNPFGPDNIVGEPQFIQDATDTLTINLKRMPFDTWYLLPH